MTLNASAPWHRASFDQLMEDRLPQLLAARLPLVGYCVESTGSYTCRVKIALASASGDVEMEYTDVPQPDADGAFEINGKRWVVLPVASQEELDLAEIRCVGEQLYDFIEARLGEAPEDLPWDVSLARAWLPLDTWVQQFLEEVSQYLQDNNWLDRRTHLRRVFISNREQAFTPGHVGRVCPFETPEGPNIGRILTVSMGAEIRDGKLVVLDERPEAGLGLAASMVPFLEHNDPNRQLMGVNMMRQCFTPPDPEPALVRTGDEPDAPDFWCGRDLLTAFISWGMDTFEDAIVVSESCAERLNYPHPVEPGDKLSNRHGTKGTVSRIVPDEEMPHLPDGTPVELIFSVFGLQSRLNFGQVREAVMGRIARAEGKPAIVPPFHAPSERELCERLKSAGLPEDGMETLTYKGQELMRPSTVGWVYWGRLVHVARDKIHASVDGTRCQRQGELEYFALRDVGAFEILAEQFNTRSTERDDAGTLAARVAAGRAEQAGPPSPKLSDLVRRLAVAGIRAAFDGDRMTFRFSPPDGDLLKLARPVPHPWLREQALTEIGAFEELPEYGALVEADERMARVLSDQAPESMIRTRCAQLEERVRELLDALLTPSHLRFGNRVLFSGRAVISPGGDLRIDQIGVAEEIAWTIFGPSLTREIGAEEAHARTGRAAQALDEIMARSWVLVNRAPTQTPTSLLAFHPVRHPDRVIRLHPLACRLLNADFDGDQMAVFLPITERAQCEVAERLSIAGHLARDPELLKEVVPTMAAIWGLASLSLTPEGEREIADLAGTEVPAPEGFLTRPSLAEAMRGVMEREGIERTLEILERLMRRGFEITKESGASMSPFIGAGLERPPEPENDDVGAWNAYAEEFAERIASRTDFGDDDLGPQLLSMKSGARGSLQQLVWLLGARGAVKDSRGTSVVIRHGYRDGLPSEEMYATAVGAREGLFRVMSEWTRFGYELRDRREPKGFNVLARAMRAKRPGVVFARAAATGEADPLLDVDSRLFVGLPAK